MVSVQNLGGSMIKKNNVWTERIIWISKSEGGRQTLPTSEKYGPIIKITGSDNNDPNWSLIVNITMSFLKLKRLRKYITCLIEHQTTYTREFGLVC